MRAKYFAASEPAESVVQQILMDIQEYDRILEIGTGNGSMFKQIIGQLEKGSLKSIETSKRKIRKTQRANRSVIKASSETFSRGDRKAYRSATAVFIKSSRYILLKQSAITGQHVKKCIAFFKLTGASIWF